MASRIISKSFPSFFENSGISADEEIDIPELRCFYSDFFHPDNNVNTNIVDTKTIESFDEKYTVYVIQVKLSFTEYLVEKRYSQFLDLYRKIERNYKYLELGKTRFPSKKFFGTFTDATIQHRKELLNGFLNLVCGKYKQEEVVEFLEFLEVRKRVEILLRLPTVESSNNLLQLQEAKSHPPSDMDQVNHYLIMLNRNTTDFYRSFREFENYFFETKPKFSKVAIKKLFYGDEELEGFIRLCGKHDTDENCHLTCGVGMKLLSRLLDHEYNRDAELFIQIFGSTNLREILFLFFDRHIRAKGSKPCKVAAIKLLNCFMNYNPSITLNQLLAEDDAILEFEMWKATQRTTFRSAESHSRITIAG